MSSKSWLIERADAVLCADSATDPSAFWTAYDNLLWAVVTSRRDELSELVQLLFDDPYIQLPPPIQVAVFRIWGLEPPTDRERAQIAIGGIAMYCSPEEETAACTGLQACSARV